MKKDFEGKIDGVYYYVSQARMQSLEDASILIFDWKGNRYSDSMDKTTGEIIQVSGWQKR